MAYTAQGVLTRQLAQAPIGDGYVSVDGLPWDADDLSVLQDANPAAVAGDVIRYDLTTSPSAFDITMRADGTFFLGAEDDGTEQTFDYYLWRKADTTWYGPETVTLEGESPPVSELSGGGTLIGVGFEPFPEGSTGNWRYTEQGVLLEQLRAFEGLGNLTGGGTLVGLAEGRGIGELSGGGVLAGVGSNTLAGSGVGNLSGGGSLSGTGFRFEWTTVFKTDDVWIKISN